MSGRPYCQVTSDSIKLRIRLTPRSSRDEIGTVTETGDGTAIQIFVRAVPTNGEANTALISLIAKHLRTQKSSVQLVSGAKSRLKVLAILVFRLRHLIPVSACHNSNVGSQRNTSKYMFLV